MQNLRTMASKKPMEAILNILANPFDIQAKGYTNIVVDDTTGELQAL